MSATSLLSRLTAVVALLATVLVACAAPAAPTPTAPAKAATPATAAAPATPAAAATTAPAVATTAAAAAPARLTPAAAPVAQAAATGPAIDRIKKAGKIVVLVDATFRPMEYTDEKGAIVGADVDIANELAKDLGVKLELSNTAWDAIFASLQAGKGDVIISSVTVTEQRKKELLFSTPYYAAGQMIVVKKENDTIKGPDDLKGKTVGVQIDTTGQEAVEKISSVNEIKKYDGGADTMLAVETGKVDAGVIDAMVALNYVKDHPATKLVSPTPFTKEDIAIAIAKENTDLQTVANQFVENIKKDGRLDKVIAEYGLK